MAEKLERKVMEIYGENAATRDIIAYGSDIAGNIVETKDPDVIQTEAYKTGVRSAVVGNNSTTLQNRQALDFLFSRQLKYLYQHGIAEWGADETYFVNSLAVGSNGNIYVSLTDNNKGNDPVTDTTNWRLLTTADRVLGKAMGEAYYSQSKLAADNPGALPLFTGETIASANTIYPDFYNWVSAHTELQCTSAEYESALSTYGECPKYVVTNSTPTRYKWENLRFGVLYTLSRNPAVGDLAYDVTGNDSWPITESSSTEIVVPTFAGDKPLSYVEEVAGTSASLRLPKLSNYIKAANTADGIKNIEAGLPDHKHLLTNTTSDFYTHYGTTNIYSVRDNGQYTNQAREKIGYASESNPIYGKSDTVTPASTTLYPWVVAYTAAISASTAQAAEFQQALTGKADTNLGNVASNLDYVVESYNDGTNWYRKYKSGWLEQGGLVTGTNTAQNVYTLVKPFTSTNYKVLVSAVGQNITCWVGAKTTTTVVIQSSDKATFGVNWRAEGQGAN